MPGTTDTRCAGKTGIIEVPWKRILAAWAFDPAHDEVENFDWEAGHGRRSGQVGGDIGVAGEREGARKTDTNKLYMAQPPDL